jgi:glycosyltransferase involved in cell wall biosynthesis
VLAQDYPNFELVISDNCSTDGSEEVIMRYTHDPRVRYSRNEKNIGMVLNFQKVFFELAAGEYITHLSSDDYFSNPKFLSKAVEMFQEHPDVSIIFGMHTQFFDKTGELQPNPLPGQYDRKVRPGKEVFLVFGDYPFFSMGGAVYSSKYIKKHNMVFSGGATGDIELNLQCMLHGNAGFINENVYMTRVHDTNASGNKGGVVEIVKMYLEVYDWMYEKASPIIEKPLLDQWYNKLIGKNIMLVLGLVISAGNRSQTMQLHRVLLKKYRSHYFKFLRKYPRYIVKMILNR